MQDAADVVDRHAAVGVNVTGQQNPGLGLGEPRPTALSAAGSGSRNSGLGPFLNQTPFELGKRREGVADKFAGGLVVSWCRSCRR